MKAGDTARLIQPVVQGQIKERRFNAADELEYRLEWTDPDGSTQQRWFAESQLQQVEAPQ